MLYFNQVIIAVERIDSYCKLPQEPALRLDSDLDLTSKSWPQTGEIEFDHVSMRYNELNEDFVLKDISFKIQGG